MTKLLDIGQACIKTAGHEKNEKCLVVDTVDDNFVLISGPRVKRRRCNIKHLEVLPQKLGISKGASDEEVFKAMLDAGIVPKDIKPRKGKIKPKEKLKKEEKETEKVEEKPKRKLFPLKKKEKEKKIEKKNLKKEEIEKEILKEVHEEIKKEEKDKGKK